MTDGPNSQPNKTITAAPTPRTYLDVLRERFGAAILQTSDFRGELTAVVAPEQIVAALTFARNDPDGYPVFEDLTAVDWLERQPRFEVVYQLFSYKSKRGLRLKVQLPVDEPTTPSITHLWAGANWYEREVYDLFGITFEGHPDLRRIMMPDDWPGYPLRKDYPLAGTERGKGAGANPPMVHSYNQRPELGPGAGGNAGVAPLTIAPAAGTRPRDVDYDPADTSIDPPEIQHTIRGEQ